MYAYVCHRNVWLCVLVCCIYATVLCVYVCLCVSMCVYVCLCVSVCATTQYDSAYHCTISSLVIRYCMTMCLCVSMCVYVCYCTVWLCVPLYYIIIGYTVVYVYVCLCVSMCVYVCYYTVWLCVPLHDIIIGYTVLYVYDGLYHSTTVSLYHVLVHHSVYLCNNILPTLRWQSIRTSQSGHPFRFDELSELIASSAVANSLCIY